MTHVNNIFGIRINSATTNASMNFGNTVHKGHQANIKMNVGYFQAGDANFSPLQFNNKNIFDDRDFKDQVQKQV